MTDSTIRAAEREGRAVAAHYRAGTLVPLYTSAREIVRTKIRSRVIREPFSPLDLLRARAFLGCEESRGLLGVGVCTQCGTCNVLPEIDGCLCCPLAYWLATLCVILALLPPARVEVACDADWCADEGPFSDCNNCQGTGKVHHDTPAERYLLTYAAWAVARECLHRAMDQGAGCSYADEWDALDACEAWIREPTRMRLLEWRQAQSGSPPSWIPEPPRDPVPGRLGADISAPLQAAADVIGEARVREIASAALLEVL